MHSNWKFFTALLLLAAVVSMGLFHAQAAPRKARPITKRNWYNHPEIKKVRAVYAEVMALAKKKKLKKREREMEECPGNVETLEIYQGPGKVVRRYKILGGGDYQTSLSDYYYDRKQRLRFVLIIITIYDRRTDKVSTREELRIYFNQSGNVLVGITKGPETKGKPTVRIRSWKTSYQLKLVFKPLAAFRKKQDC